MSSMLRTACLIVAALGAGMISQELVCRLLAAEPLPEERQGPVAQCWSSAETYYGHAELPTNPRWQHAVLVDVQPEDTTSKEPAIELVAVVESNPAELADETCHQPDSVAEITPIEPDMTGLTVALPVSLLAQNDRLALPPVVEPAEQMTLPPQDNPQAPATVSEPLPVQPPTIDVLPPPIPEPVCKSTRSPEDYLIPGSAASEPISPPGYEMGRYIDASELIRQQAATRAEQRRQRIELRKWMGYIPSRPPVPVTPTMSGGPYRSTIFVVPYSVQLPAAPRR